jgi:hypothetical protein
MVARGVLVATEPFAAADLAELSGGRLLSGLGACRADDIVTYLMLREHAA